MPKEWFSNSFVCYLLVHFNADQAHWAVQVDTTNRLLPMKVATQAT